MIDKLILFPYYLTLVIRHKMYDKGFLCKSRKAAVPTICVGNVTVGGTGKTPHTEMILRMLQESKEWSEKNLAVLSRGYKRKGKRFQQVMADGHAYEYGDEPLQIKKKFPSVTVAVDANRVEGCSFLCDPSLLQSSKKARKCKHKEMKASDMIILDDAFQHRKLSADLNIVLIDYFRPVTKDRLIPLGRLRDLASRIRKADIVIVTKCPYLMEQEDRVKKLSILGYSDYDPVLCQAKNKKGKIQKVFFTKTEYKHPETIFEDADPRYMYSKKVILFSGIANDSHLKMFLSDSYKIVSSFSFSDHHAYSAMDLSSINRAVRNCPTAAIATTEKDAQRLLDCKSVPESIRQRVFQVPIEAVFFSDSEKDAFRSTFLSNI